MGRLGTPRTYGDPGVPGVLNGDNIGISLTNSHTKVPYREKFT